MRIGSDKYPHSCRLCKEQGASSELLRRQWGCDSPTDHEQDRIDCLACGGELPNCQRCSGRGYISIYRCPRTMVCPEVWDGLRVALRAKSAGIWPVAGGSQDQARAFLQLYDVVADEVARIEAEEMKSASK